MLTLEKAQEMVAAVVEPENQPGEEPEITASPEKLNSLSEVARYLKVSENRIRHWEKSFSQILSNHRNQYNHRMFTDADVKILERIKFLQDSRLYTREGIMARITGKVKNASANANVGADRAYQQKLLVALNTLASEIKSLRREVREDLKGEMKKELDHLTLLLFPPKKEKKWYQFFR